MNSGKTLEEMIAVCSKQIFILESYDFGKNWEAQARKVMRGKGLLGFRKVYEAYGTGKTPLEAVRSLHSKLTKTGIIK
jgi:hypothetical protein